MFGEVECRDQCDDCMAEPRPWLQGRAALLYEGRGRELVLALKHGDRQELAWPLARWMAQAAGDLVRPDTIVVPVPLHWTRLVKRRYNQSALLAKGVAKVMGLPYCGDLLRRTRVTVSLEGMSRAERYAALDGAIGVQAKRAPVIEARRVLLVDDVMTTGATLTASSRACLASHANEVCIVTLARVAKDT